MKDITKISAFAHKVNRVIEQLAVFSAILMILALIMYIIKYATINFVAILLFVIAGTILYVFRK